MPRWQLFSLTFLLTGNIFLSMYALQLISGKLTDGLHLAVLKPLLGQSNAPLRQASRYYCCRA
jgi:hypothetical protein